MSIKMLLSTWELGTIVDFFNEESTLSTCFCDLVRWALASGSVRLTSTAIAWGVGIAAATTTGLISSTTGLTTTGSGISCFFSTTTGSFGFSIFFIGSIIFGFSVATISLATFFCFLSFWTVTHPTFYWT